MAVYPVMADPPLDAGATQDTVACAFPPEAVTEVGEPGVEATKVNEFASVAEPPGVVTATSTVPVPAGVVATTDVAVLAVIVAFTPPKVTGPADDRFVPVMVTDVPPPTGPDVGLIDDTAGAGTLTYS